MPANVGECRKGADRFFPQRTQNHHSGLPRAIARHCGALAHDQLSDPGTENLRLEKGRNLNDVSITPQIHKALGTNELHYWDFVSLT
jgi:hypothetical protein